MTTTSKPAQTWSRLSLNILYFAGSLFLFACYHAADQWHLNRTGVFAIGEVTEVSGKKRRNPTVRFEAPNGQSYVFREMRSMSYSPQIGQRLQVVFHPQRPDDAYVVITQWVGVRLILVFAFLFACMGFMVHYKPIIDRRIRARERSRN